MLLLRDLSCVVMVVVVLVLQQRVVPLGKRFHAVYLIKKKKNESVLVNFGTMVSSFFCCCFKKESPKLNDKPKKNVFDKMNKNITGVMFSYLDGREVTKLSQVNKKLNTLSNDWVVWKNILEDQFINCWEEDDIGWVSFDVAVDKVT